MFAWPRPAPAVAAFECRSLPVLPVSVTGKESASSSFTVLSGSPSVHSLLFQVPHGVWLLWNLSQGRAWLLLRVSTSLGRAGNGGGSRRGKGARRRERKKEEERRRRGKWKKGLGGTGGRGGVGERATAEPCGSPTCLLRLQLPQIWQHGPTTMPQNPQVNEERDLTQIHCRGLGEGFLVGHGMFGSSRSPKLRWKCP